MSLKLVVVLVFVAFAGQGLAWPIETSEDENLLAHTKTVISPLLRQSEFSIIGGVIHCFNDSVQIVVQATNQATLFVRAHTLKFSLAANVLGCFFKKDVTAVYDCGSSSFTRYRAEANKIEQERLSSKQRLDELLQDLPNCLSYKPERPNRPVPPEF